MSDALQVNQVSKSYGTFEALKKISLNIPYQSIYGIIGTSGAGKSTLLKILSTLEKPDSGSITLLGQDIQYEDYKSLRYIRQHMGVVFQNYQLLSSLNVQDNIALPLTILEKPQAYIDQQVQKMLTLVGLETKKHLYPAHLSGGQKQRVAIARALISEPKIILCDEPTAALDPENTHGVLELLKNINQQLETTIVLVSHEIGLMGAICDQIAIIHDGKVIESGPIHEVFFEPKQTATQKLISPRPPHLSQFADLVNLDKVQLFELRFMGESAKAPIVSELVGRFNIHPNILQGAIDKIGKTTLGSLVVSFEKDHPKLKDALQYLIEQKIILRELN